MDTGKRVAGIVVAGGRGSRLGGPPKQWRDLGGMTVAGRAVEALARAGLSPLVLVHPASEAAEAAQLRPGLLLVPGGATRSDSVRAGLEALAADPPDLVLIHDAARPCATPALIARVVAALDDSPGAAPALPVTDALWRGGSIVEGTQARDGLWRAQTPQGFRFDAILAAHRAHPGGAADDVEVARAAGLAVAIVAGEEDNIKVTHPGDLERAARILEQRMDVRMGNGYDVHAFGPGDHVTLCGVRISHSQGVLAHSDGDVGLHALTDAILGALALGDIGQHFPPSDPQWKGADSTLFLRHAGALAREAGYRVSNVDVTVVCEAPKVGPHVPAMKQAIGQSLGLTPDRVSIKATTSERLGFTGRREGVAALATATLVSA
ncbi:bifunctional 2-C-methyl-D-erythritol 4-phosphate cytidylyltransferase/2-C-methyl-D-erythritol 2,4-cyclodiphosphate synthase [Rubellimicrobium aerolatum]|uniref:Bifunctional enzyme IspD/IspF n=1 Tax=Rubellimicrobium aerolatum TaxID=490979 RepID=A0ABW0S8A2_9RHOB|nr:bifunctional 2-C-methyl-D-erythritol 4-phosphate cytidylyltransferase/2-C-methyl-D-erythritol 2,4-cyclodiphosphate synthase [Rubellimicrobium aerolatum]MBP1804319.1 2-C-methyl-D-erythritol 4-phosphate cytidylyltransferase/2-C-methyl-D-erythritol 2,4-cyclodiphosphate synthase [Rubellimicrobium aerolatum]